jgi:hypothetical protein
MQIRGFTCDRVISLKLGSLLIGSVHYYRKNEKRLQGQVVIGLAYGSLQLIGVVISHL